MTIRFRVWFFYGILVFVSNNIIFVYILLKRWYLRNKQWLVLECGIEDHIWWQKEAWVRSSSALTWRPNTTLHIIVTTMWSLFIAIWSLFMTIWSLFTTIQSLSMTISSLSIQIWYLPIFSQTCKQLYWPYFTATTIHIPSNSIWYLLPQFTARYIN